MAGKTKRAKAKSRKEQTIAAVIALVLSVATLFGFSSNATSGTTDACTETPEAVSRTYIDDDGSFSAVKSSGIPAVKVEPSEIDAINTPSMDGKTVSNVEPLVVRFIDVGQGDCTLISCNGQNLLIDGGPPKASSKLYAILERLGITHLDYLIVSHADADHCGGVSGAISYASCGVCYAPIDTSDTKTYETLVRLLDAQGLGITKPSQYDSFALGDATVTFVGPSRSFLDDNNGSLIVRLEFGDTSFLFTGDAEVPSENALVADGAPLRSDVLKVAHHGSASSTSRSFIEAVDPAYAIISVGDNGYGHPAQATLDLLSERNTAIMRTDIDGTIIAKSNGEAIAFDSVKGFIYE